MILLKNRMWPDLFVALLIVVSLVTEHSTSSFPTHVKICPFFCTDFSGCPNETLVLRRSVGKDDERRSVPNYSEYEQKYPDQSEARFHFKRDLRSHMERSERRAVEDGSPLENTTCHNEMPGLGIVAAVYDLDISMGTAEEGFLIDTTHTGPNTGFGAWLNGSLGTPWFMFHSIMLWITPTQVEVYEYLCDEDYTANVTFNYTGTPVGVIVQFVPTTHHRIKMSVYIDGSFVWDFTTCHLNTYPPLFSFGGAQVYTEISTWTEHLTEPEIAAINSVGPNDCPGKCFNRALAIPAIPLTAVMTWLIFVIVLLVAILLFILLVVSAYMLIRSAYAKKARGY